MLTFGNDVEGDSRQKPSGTGSSPLREESNPIVCLSPCEGEANSQKGADETSSEDPLTFYPGGASFHNFKRSRLGERLYIQLRNLFDSYQR